MSPASLLLHAAVHLGCSPLLALMRKKPSGVTGLYEISTIGRECPWHTSGAYADVAACFAAVFLSGVDRGLVPLVAFASDDGSDILALTESRRIRKFYSQREKLKTWQRERVTRERARRKETEQRWHRVPWRDPGRGEERDALRVEGDD